MTVEVSWFSALCDDDYRWLGVPDPALRSSFEHCRDIVLRAWPRSSSSSTGWPGTAAWPAAPWPWRS